MRLGGSCHGDGSIQIDQTVISLVLNLRRCRAVFHFCIKAAALDHEIRDYAVKNGAGIVTGFGVGDKIGDGFRRLYRIQFKLDCTEGGGYLDFHGFSRVGIIVVQVILIDMITIFLCGCFFC